MAKVIRRYEIADDVIFPEAPRRSLAQPAMLKWSIRLARHPQREYPGSCQLLVDQFPEGRKFRGVTSDIYQLYFVGF